MKEEDGVGWYLKQAGRVPLLTPSEEIELGKCVQAWQQNKKDPLPNKRIERRGRRAYNRMFLANLRLVINVSKKYVHVASHMSLLDLIQEGNLGLSRAIEKYDPSRGYKFSTYAYWWIKQACQRSLSQLDRTIRLPINAIDVQTKVKRFWEEFNELHGKNPTVEQCCEHVGVRAVTMRAYLLHIVKPTTLDQPVAMADKEAVPKTLLEMIPSEELDPFEQLELDSAAIHLDDYLEGLPVKQEQVLRLRYGLDTGGEGLTYEEIGEILETSRERVRQLEQKSLKVLQCRMIARADRDLAD